MPIRGSAAWEITIVLVTAFLVGSLLHTTFDPIFQDVFASALWEPTTSTTGDLLGWIEAGVTYLALFLLFGFVSRAWIWTRRTG